MKIVIIGTGYVGLVSGACFSDVGHRVICVDTDPARVAVVNNCKAPFHEDGLNTILERVVSSGSLEATSDLAHAMVDADITLIAVGTPFDGSVIDLKYIKQATKDVARFLHLAAAYHVVCVKSTVIPGTTDDVVGPILEEHSKRKIGTDLGLAMNPEFLAEGSAVFDFMNPDRIVIGSNNDQAAQTLIKLYEPFVGTDLIITQLATAEMIKYTSNAFLASVISFSNEIANLCSKLDGVDILDVLGGVHSDRRLSPLLDIGRVTPGLMSFLHPGTGFGGSCFPKDVKALISFAEQKGSQVPILKSVIETNILQTTVTVDLVKEELTTLFDKRIVVLGLAFKPGTDDIRESPALNIIKSLVESGAKVVAHDPIAIANMERQFSSPMLSYCSNLREAVKDADAVILVTSWPEYNDLHMVLDVKGIPVIDGRRSLNKYNFERYRGIGIGGSSSKHKEIVK